MYYARILVALAATASIALPQAQGSALASPIATPPPHGLDGLAQAQHINKKRASTTRKSDPSQGSDKAGLVPDVVSGLLGGKSTKDTSTKESSTNAKESSSTKESSTKETPSSTKKAATPKPSSSDAGIIPDILSSVLGGPDKNTKTDASTDTHTSTSSTHTSTEATTTGGGLLSSIISGVLGGGDKSTDKPTATDTTAKATGTTTDKDSSTSTPSTTTTDGGIIPSILSSILGGGDTTSTTDTSTKHTATETKTSTETDSSTTSQGIIPSILSSILGGGGATTTTDSTTTHHSATNTESDSSTTSQGIIPSILSSILDPPPTTTDKPKTTDTNTDTSTTDIFSSLSSIISSVVNPPTTTTTKSSSSDSSTTTIGLPTITLPTIIPTTSPTDTSTETSTSTSSSSIPPVASSPTTSSVPTDTSRQPGSTTTDTTSNFLGTTLDLPSTTESVAPTATGSTATGTAATTASTFFPFPTNWPSYMVPAGGSPAEPAGYSAVQIAFDKTLSWLYLATNQKPAAQIFTYGPSMIANALVLPSNQVLAASLQPFETVADAASGSMTSVLVMFIPSGSVQALQAAMNNPESGLFTQPTTTIEGQLSQHINSKWPVLVTDNSPLGSNPGQSISSGGNQTTSAGSSSSNSDLSGGNNNGGSGTSSNKGWIIAVAVVGATLLYAAATFFIIRAYKRSKANRAGSRGAVALGNGYDSRANSPTGRYYDSPRATSPEMTARDPFSDDHGIDTHHIAPGATNWGAAVAGPTPELARLARQNSTSEYGLGPGHEDGRVGSSQGLWSRGGYGQNQPMSHQQQSHSHSQPIGQPRLQDSTMGW